MAIELDKLPKDEKSGLPVVQAPTKGNTNIVIPEKVSASTFIDEFEVEQLPEQGKAEDLAKGTTKVEDKKGEPAQPALETVDQKTEKADENVEDKKEETTKVNSLDKILKKPGQKKDETIKPEDKKTDETIKPIVPSKTTRDYTGFSPEEVTALKGMSNEGFAYAVKMRKENQELAKLRDTTYLQHEKAYTLTPEYQELSQTTRLANFETKYWNEQLIAMDAGKDLIPLKGYDTRTGQPVFGEPLKPSKQLEEEVRQAMYDASNLVRTNQAKLSEFPQRYKSTIQQELSNIENYRKSQFGWVADPTMLDYTMDIGGKEKSLKQIREDVISMVPPALRNNPLVGVLGDLVIAVQIQKAQLSAYESTNTVAKTKEEETELVEPSSKDKPISKGSKDEEVHGMKEFKIDPMLV